MKLEETYHNIITELRGISPQARAWTTILSEVFHNTTMNNFVVIGQEYPDAYKNFPVDIFHIKKSRGYAGYDENASGYNEEGKYVVYLHIPVIEKDITKERMLSALNHELRHAFEDYNRISKNKTRLSNSKESKEFYSGDFESFMLGRIPGNFEPFKSIFRSLYLTSKIEESAYSETIYDDPNASIMNSIKEILKRNYLVGLENDKLVEKQWNKLKREVKIPILDKFDDYMMFIKWADGLIQKRAMSIYKKLVKVRYLATINKKGDD